MATASATVSMGVTIDDMYENCHVASANSSLALRSSQFRESWNKRPEES